MFLLSEDVSCVLVCCERSGNNWELQTVNEALRVLNLPAKTRGTRWKSKRLTIRLYGTVRLPISVPTVHALRPTVT